MDSLTYFTMKQMTTVHPTTGVFCWKSINIFNPCEEAIYNMQLMADFLIVFQCTHSQMLHFVPLELEGAKLPLYQVAVQYLLTPKVTTCSYLRKIIAEKCHLC